MKIVANKSDLLKAVKLVGKAVAAKSPNPALEGIYMVANKETNDLTIKGYDLELGIETTIPVDIVEDGTILVSSKLFTNIISSAPDGRIQISTGKKDVITIKTNASRHRITGMDISEYPEFPKIKELDSIDVRPDLLKEMIKMVIYAAGKNCPKPVHNGIQFKVRENVLYLVGLDGYRLAVAAMPIEHKDVDFVMPNKALTSVLECVSDYDNKVKIIVSDRHIIVQTISYKIVTRLLEGVFMDFEGMVPKKSTFSCTVDQYEFLKALQRIQIMNDTKATSPIKVSYDKNDAVLKCTLKSPIGEAYEEISTKVKKCDEELLIGFNNRYLMDAVEHCIRFDEIHLNFNGPLSPLIIRKTPEEECEFNFFHMVVPMRIKDDVEESKK